MKTYDLKHGNLVTNTQLTKKAQLLMYINARCIDALELAIASEDARRISNIIDNFSMKIYKATGVWFNTFDYYYEYSDNLNAYVDLMIRRLNKAFA